MTLTETERQAIRLVLAEWLEAPHLPDLVPVARKLQALPVYADIGAALLVTLSGEVVAVSTDRPWDANAVASHDVGPEWARLAHLEASRRHPTLDFLRPIRSSGAADCPQCSGTGWAIAGSAGSRFRCGGC
jgi:hypothetical protein